MPIPPLIQSVANQLDQLVIDDDRAVADTLVMVLNAAGLGTSTVYSGETGVALATGLEFEFLVTGVIMPMMNGIEAAIQICQLLPKCKVLLVSGDNDTNALLQDAGEPSPGPKPSDSATARRRSSLRPRPGYMNKSSSLTFKFLHQILAGAVGPRSSSPGGFFHDI